MRRSFLLAVIVLALGASMLPARASVTTSADITQVFNISTTRWTPYSNFWLYAARTRSASSTSTNLDWKVAAGYYICDPTCVGRNFPLQAVPGSAQLFDPAGNSGTLNAVLVDDQTIPGAGYFNLTFTRPSNLAQCFACGEANPWFDPTTDEAGATIGAMPGFSRYGYTPAGSFAGIPYPVVGPSDGWSDSAYFINALIGVSAIAP